MMSAPPVTPPEARFARASDATLVPTVDLKVTAERIIDRGSKGGGGSGFGSAVLEMDTELFKNIVRVGKHVHQVRNRSALIACHVGNAGLQKGFGDGKDAFATKFLALAEVKFLDFFLEEALRH